MENSLLQNKITSILSNQWHKVQPRVAERLPSNFYSMEPDMEKINARAEEYAARFVERYQKVAKKAYIDGVMAVLKDWINEE